MHIGNLFFYDIFNINKKLFLVQALSQLCSIDWAYKNVWNINLKIFWAVNKIFILCTYKLINFAKHTIRRNYFLGRWHVNAIIFNTRVMWCGIVRENKDGNNFNENLLRIKFLSRTKWNSFLIHTHIYWQHLK